MMHRHFAKMMVGHPHAREAFRDHEAFAARFAAMGAGMRMGKFLTSEQLQLIVLHLLSEKPRHGYEIIKAIEERTSGAYAPSPGMIYPALTYLEEVSYAVSQADGAKKLYQITEAGAAFLEKNRDEANAILEHLKAYGQRAAYFHEHMAEEEFANESWGGSPREQEKREWRELKADFNELRRELKSAIYEKFGASLEEKKRVLGVLRRAISEIRGR
jgi:DNA-binding PadR family transcriptional regulator